MRVPGTPIIPTAVHGCIDFGLAALFGAVAASSSVSPVVRRSAALAGAYHAGYSLATDYELGLRPWLSMRQHLLLDTLGAAAVFGAGVGLRTASQQERRLLVAAGLLELAVIALSDRRPTSGPARPVPAEVGYEPVDTLKPVAEGVFIVDSCLPGLLGSVPIRMTVIRLPDGGLLLHSPTRMTDGLREELRRIGPVAHLLAPNIAHWMLMKQWQDAYPEAVTWAAPGLAQRRAVRRSGLRLDLEVGPVAPTAWGNTIEITLVPGAFGFHEAALFHRPSGTLVLTDLVVNLEPSKLPGPMRLIARLFGSLAPSGMPPPYLRMIVKMRAAEAKQAVQRLFASNPERIIFAHGRWFDTDAMRQFRESMRWL